MSVFETDGPYAGSAGMNKQPCQMNIEDQLTGLAKEQAKAETLFIALEKYLGPNPPRHLILNQVTAAGLLGGLHLEQRSLQANIDQLMAQQEPAA